MGLPPQRSPVPPPASAPVDEPDDFAARFAEAYSKLTLIATGITGDRTGAEDVVQDAALIAVEKRTQLHPGASFAGWLASIVRNCALNSRRKVRRRRTFAADPREFRDLPQQASAPVAPAGESSLGRVDAEAFDDQVLAALDELSDEARCCLLLRTVEDLPYSEIAALMGIPEGTAMSHVYRAKTTLRRRLASRSPAGSAPAEDP